MQISRPYGLSLIPSLEVEEFVFKVPLPVFTSTPGLEKILE